MSNGNAYCWDIAKQVPQLAVLSLLTYWFLNTLTALHISTVSIISENSAVLSQVQMLLVKLNGH